MTGIRFSIFYDTLRLLTLDTCNVNNCHTTIRTKGQEHTRSTGLIHYQKRAYMNVSPFFARTSDRLFSPLSLRVVDIHSPPLFGPCVKNNWPTNHCPIAMPSRRGSDAPINLPSLIKMACRPEFISRTLTLKPIFSKGACRLSALLPASSS